MKAKDVTIYICDLCNKKYFRKHAAVSHEERCTKNPDNFRPCFTCQFLQKEKIDLSEGPIRFVASLMHCKKKAVFLHPPSVEKKGNKIDLGGENYPMPRNCNLYKSSKIGSPDEPNIF